MGKLLISEHVKKRFPVRRVNEVKRGSICCWPQGTHLFLYYSHDNWRERVELRYLDECGFPSFAPIEAVNKTMSSTIIVIREAGDATPLVKILRAAGSTTEGNITMSKLFQTKEATPRFGTLLATNSAGLYVMEMKGTGEVLTFAKTEVEEVKPYTVRIRFSNSNSEYDYLSRKGDVDKGDVIIVSGSVDFAQVVAVDTKSDRATKDLVGRKMMTAPFGEGALPDGEQK